MWHRFQGAMSRSRNRSSRNAVSNQFLAAARSPDVALAFVKLLLRARQAILCPRLPSARRRHAGQLFGAPAAIQARMASICG